jgi:glycosyltransferase involved in cell wall biosynthesis
MKKICIDARYIFPQMDGIGRYLYNLIDQITTITSGTNEYHFFILEVEEFAPKSVLRSFDSRKNISFIRIPVKPQTIKNHFVGRYLKKLQIDLYHYPQFDLPWFVSGFKIVTSILDMNPQKMPGFFPTKNGWIKKYYAILTNWVALKKSDKLITISESTKHELLEFYNFHKGNKIQAVHLGVDAKFFNHSDKEVLSKIISELRVKHNFNKYFLYVGNNRPHKNLERVLIAFKSVLKKIDFELKFLLVGQQLKNNTDIDALVMKLGLKENVISLELSDEELNAVYSNSEAFVFCSLSEGFGLPVLEAMALGCPVITSNLSSMKEIAEGAALLANPYSLKSIEGSMIQLVNDKNLRKELIEKGFNKAQLFTWKKCAEETLTIYSQLLNV